jgi:hypothetical protein
MDIAIGICRLYFCDRGILADIAADLIDEPLEKGHGEAWSTGVFAFLLGLFVPLVALLKLQVLDGGNAVVFVELNAFIQALDGFLKEFVCGVFCGFLDSHFSPMETQRSRYTLKGMSAQRLPFLLPVFDHDCLRLCGPLSVTGLLQS